MKILHINTYDISGGAARAAYRLHQGLRQINLDSKMLVQDKKGDDKHVLGPKSKMGKAWGMVRPNLDRLPLHLYTKKKDTPYYLQWLPGSSLEDGLSFAPDIVHLHWICGGFIPIASMAKIKQPIIWTLHDSWAFTGGCHIPYECTRYKKKCGNCPHLGSRWERDLSRWTWHRKQKAWQNLNLTIVVPSKWLAQCTKESSLFQNTNVVVIPNGLDLNQYKPVDQSLARKLLGLPENKKILLFGAMNATSDQQKGFQYLQPALWKLKESQIKQEIEIIVFGSSEPEHAPDFGFPVHYLGRLHDDISLKILYSAADVMLVPSTQETFGQTASEAMACGTPVVAFNVTGLKDIVDHRINGYLAQPFDPADLAHGVEFLFAEETDVICKRRVSARKKIEENFEIRKVAMIYRDLYESCRLPRAYT